MKNPFRSLPARIVFLVFAATLLTSLSVTGVSLQLIDSFLRESINQKFPDVINMASEKIDHWYVQRLREMAVFSKSEVVQSNLAALAPEMGAKRAERAREELEQYIAYVLDGFPQYSALFILDPQHEHLLWVGEEIDLGPEQRADAGVVSASRIGELLKLPEGPAQIVSAPLRDTSGRSLGSLHAVLRLGSLRETLPAEELGPSGRILLVTAAGRLVMSSDDRDPADPWSGPLLEPAKQASLQEYTAQTGERVVGTAQPLSRFGWTLIVEQPYSEAMAPVFSTLGRMLAINLAIVLGVGLVAFRIAVSIVRPIDALSDAARRISDGERSVVIPEIRSRDEVGVLASAFSEMTTRLTNNAAELELSHAAVEEANERLRMQNDELQGVNEVLEQLSITDGLTKLHNHRYFQEALIHECKRAGRTETPLSLILIDLDYFKRWNDRFGHAGGDQILSGIARVMTDLVRETDRLARYGGEEFALLTPGTVLEGAAMLAEKIRAAVAASSFDLDLPGGHEPVTVSIGVAAYRGDPKALFNDADRALYRAKEAGRDCVIVAEPS